MRRFPLSLLLLILLYPPYVFAQVNLNGIRLDAFLGQMSDEGNIAGFQAMATDLYDSGIDLPEPPAPQGSCLMVSFGSMTGAPAWYGSFREDWRADSFDPSTDTAVFPINVQVSEATGTVELQFTLGDQLPAQAPVSLYHDGLFQDVRTNSSFSFEASTASDHDLSLIIGTPPEPTITFENPTGNPLFVSGDQEVLAWQVLGEVAIEGTVVDISLDNGSSWSTLVEEGNLVEETAWTIPTQSTEEGQLRVEVIDHLDRQSSNIASFRIQDQTEWLTGVQVTAPEDGTPVVAGESVPVSWNYEGGDDNVSGAVVEYRISDAPYQLVSEVTGTGTTTTWVPPTDVFSSEVTIRVMAEVSEGEGFSGFAQGLTLWPLELLNDNFELWTDQGAETGPPDDWETNGAGYGSSFEVVRSDENAVEGFYSARLEALEPCSFSLLQEIANPIEGTQVLLRVSLLDNEVGITGRIVLSALDNAGDVLQTASSDGTVNSADFQTLAASVTIPASSAALRLEIEGTATEAGYLLADLVRLEQSSPNPDITFSSPTSGDVFTFDGETTFEVVWSYGATAPFVASASLDVSLDDGASWQELATFEDASPTTYSWIGEDNYSLRTLFRVRATNDEGIEGNGTSDYLILRPSSSSTALDGGWHLISIPLEADEMTVGTILQDDLPSAIVYSYQPSLDPIYELTTELTIGEGYWLGIDQDASFDVEGIAEIESMIRPLENGWNLIGSGYPIAVPVQQIKLADDTDTLSFGDAVTAGWVTSTLYGTPDGTGFYTELDETGSLDVWEGYWLGLLDGNRTMILPAPLPDEAPLQRHPGDDLDELDEEGEFLAPVLLLVDGNETCHVDLGQMIDASNGYDPSYDQPAPPPSPIQQLPRLTILNEAETLPTGQHFLADIHACLSEEMPRDQWFLEVTGTASGTLVLDLTGVADGLPEGYEARLFLDQQSYDLLLSPTIELPDSNPAIRLEIFSPDLAAIEPPSQPSQFELHRIWPNPFNASVHVEVELPLPSPVHVSLYDVTGRLVGEWSRELQAGRPTLTLQPSVSSGVYLLRIALPGGKARSGKIVVLK
ncbi:T9SS type A sorting domain-containing protein [bacterium]|nr:T9SS type A sorting domain-containing protein [bacterium]